MLAELQRCFREDRVLYTQHARREMRDEPFGRILEQEIYEAISAGEIIEDYPDDTPYPSCLVFGLNPERSASSRRLCSRAGRGQGHHHYRLRARPGSLD